MSDVHSAAQFPLTLAILTLAIVAGYRAWDATQGHPEPSIAMRWIFAVAFGLIAIKQAWWQIHGALLARDHTTEATWMLLHPWVPIPANVLTILCAVAATALVLRPHTKFAAPISALSWGAITVVGLIASGGL